MTVSALTAAKYMCRKSGWKYSNLEIQKLLYLSHMFHLVHESEQPLLEERFEAWQWGPVIPILYYQLKINGTEPIKRSFLAWKLADDARKDSSEVGWMDYITDLIPPGNGPRLVALTHYENGAWRKHYEHMKNNVIPDSYIVEEYHARKKEHESTAK